MKSQRVNGNLPQEASQKRKYNVLICGAGGQGALSDAPGSENENKIISFGHAFKEHEGFETITFYDKDILKSKTAAEIWDCYYSECDISYICKYGNIDVAVVATNDDAHYDVLKQLLKYPPKLVICEKPICTDLQQAKDIIDLYKIEGTPLMVNYTRRFLPYYQDLKKSGKPLFGICNFNRGWLHTATHGIDFFEMIGLKEYKILEHKSDLRIWQLVVWFENCIVWQEHRFEGDPVWSYYDKSHWHVVNNAYEFLEGRQPLACTGEQALKALEICYELMEGRNE